MTRIGCNVCGQWIAKGTGHEGPEPDFADRHAHIEYEGWLASLPAEAGGFKWTCEGCWDAAQRRESASHALEGILGVTEPESAAGRILEALIEFDPMRHEFRGGITAEAHGQVTGRAWAHVTDDERDRLREAYADLIASRMPRASAWGGCGMCGRDVALGDWWEAPGSLRWPDGGTVAFCDHCAKVWLRRGQPTFVDDLRRVGVEAATGWPVPLGSDAPADFRLFCESRAADPVGLPSPWSWSPELFAYIESVWEALPGYAPQDRREEFDRRHDDRRRERAALHRQERERQEATAW